MPKRLVLVVLAALSLVAVGCNSPSGLTATGSASVSGSSAAGPFTGAFNFPGETQISGSMCTISRGTGAGGAAVYGVVFDLIAPASTGNPVERMTLMARSDATTGTIEASVRGVEYSNSACAYNSLYVGPDGSANLRTASDCTLTTTAGGTVLANASIVVRGCTVIGE